MTKINFAKVRCIHCGLVFSTKPIRLKYQQKDWRRCQNKCQLVTIIKDKKLK